MEELAPMRYYFESGATLPIGFRRAQLKRLGAGIKAAEGKILAALAQDLGKGAFEAYSTEVGIVYSEIKTHLKGLRRWSARKRVRQSIAAFPSSSYTIARPKGVVLIISPWNYPFQLSIVPLISAIAAGNCALIKPSAKSRATTAVIKELITSLFDPSFVQVNEDRSVIEERWDHIFFTGGTKTGSQIMRKAGESLTSVTLELGGKSPAIVEANSNIALAAKRIIWGKCLNSGQTCVAPDYVLVERPAKEALVQAMKASIIEMFGSNPMDSEDLGTIIDAKHFAGLISLLHHGTILSGGKYDEKRLKIEPTLFGDVDLQSPLMQEEIFGPLLPIIEYESFDEALSWVRDRPHPLAAYLFSNNSTHQKRFVEELPFGGGCINDVVLHLANSRLPFGGVGPSGMGNYHGEAGFLAFSHIKSITKSSRLIDVPVRYAPYKGKLGLLKALFR